MIDVICVLRSGGVYDRSWVHRLEAAVDRHLPEPHRFLCRTDDLVLTNSIPLRFNWPGYWSKIELFRIEHRNPTLYLDLDSLVVGPLTPLIRRGEGFSMVQDFLNPRLANSCVMSWSGNFKYLYEDFRDEDPKTLMQQFLRTPEGNTGDQAWIETRLKEEGAKPDFFSPELVVSYRKQAKDGPPLGASVVQFHGRPKPHTITTGWVADAWQPLERT